MLYYSHLVYLCTQIYLQLQTPLPEHKALPHFSCYGPAGIGDNTTNRFCYDLDSLNYEDDDLVSSITNIGGNGTAWSQSTTANQPAFQLGSSAMNGHPVLEFDGVNDYLMMPDQNDLNKSTSNERTYIVVVRTSNDITNRQVIYEEGGATRGINFYIVNSKTIRSWLE